MKYIKILIDSKKAKMSKFLIILLLAMGAMTLRAIVSLQSYSGYAKPPMFGDFEAQRHWQEITTNLPITEWYTNTTNNDLMYWGLDYPPLTAYHSWILGKFAKFVNSSYVELHKSRGITSDEHKTFMRNSVLIADFLIYIPALIIAMNTISKGRLSTLCYVIVLFYPGQILIDNGHFQYNNISLGFACLAVAFIFKDLDRIAAVFFVLALNYKQMELYHALPFFIYLLSRSFSSSTSNGFIGKSVTALKNVSILGLIVIGLFAVIWAPWLRTVEQLKQVIQRIFPVARGVFEDKVSNVWCVVNVFYKLKVHFTNEQMAIVCFTCTLIAVVPSCIHLFFRAEKNNFLLSLINCSLAFFLFSFQVHEKTILLVTLPVMLYFNSEPLICLWFLQIASFSMLPLFVLDQLVWAYVSLNIIYLVLIRLVLALTMHSKQNLSPKWDVLSLKHIVDSELIICLYYLSTFIGCALLLLGQQSIKPPQKLPFLFPLLISAYSCIHFVAFFIYFNYRQLAGATVQLESSNKQRAKVTEASHDKKKV